MNACSRSLSDPREKLRNVILVAALLTLGVGGAVPLGAQTLECSSLFATNSIIRVEGHSELVGDIVFACTQPLDPTSTPTPAGALVPTADITISIANAVITSKIINGGDPNSSGTPISEATLLVDDLKDQTCGFVAQAALPKAAVTQWHQPAVHVRMILAPAQLLAGLGGPGHERT